MFDRLKSFSRPTLSILARCTGYNTFILSVMPFSLSYFGLTSKDLNWLRQAASKYILKRFFFLDQCCARHNNCGSHETVLKQSSVDNSIAKIGQQHEKTKRNISSKGSGLKLKYSHISFGMLGSPHCLTLHCQRRWLLLAFTFRQSIGRPPPIGHDARCSNSSNSGQRAVVQDLMNMWHPYVLFEEIFSALTARAGTPAQIIANLKKVIISGMVREAKSRLAIKIDGKGWKNGIHIWFFFAGGCLG